MLSTFDKKVHALSDLLCDSSPRDREAIHSSLLNTDASELDRLCLSMERFELPGRPMLKQIFLLKSLKDIREDYTKTLSQESIFEKVLCQIDHLINHKNNEAAIHVEMNKLMQRFPKGMALRDFIKAFTELNSHQINYQDDETCSIFRTLKSGKGMPVIICAIAIWLGKNCGLELRGISLPGHFILSGVSSTGETLYFDPATADGFEKNEETIRSLVNRYGYDLRPEMLEPVNEDLVLMRIMNNLYRIWSKENTMLKMNLVGSMIEMIKSRKV